MKYFLLLSFVCVAFIGVDVYFANKYTSSLTTSIEKRKEDYKRLYEFTFFFSNLKDSETGERGYILTKNPSYLDPYESALTYFHSKEFEAFAKKELTNPNPQKAEKAELLFRLKDDKLQDLKKTIELRNNEGLEAAIHEIEKNHGKNAMDKIRQLIQPFIEESFSSLEEDNKQIQEITKSTLREFILSDLSEIFLILICLFFIYRYLRKILQKEKEIRFAKERLAESVAVQNAIFNSTHYAILATNAHGIITAFNPAAEKILEYSREEIVGKYTPELFHDKKEMEEKSLEIFKQYHRKVEGFEILTEIAKQKSHDTSEWKYTRKNGTTFPGQCSVTAIKDKKGRVVGFVEIIQDITERKQIDLMKDELIAIAGFEFREPIAAIKGVFDLLSLKDDSISEKTRRIIEIGKRNCSHLINIVNDIFEMQKIETEKVPFIFKKTNLSTFLQILAQNQTPIANQAHVQLQYLPSEQPCFVKIDNDRLMHILEHLISNSIRRSTPGDTIKIEWKQINSHARIEIKDQSSSAPSEFYQQIFQTNPTDLSIVNISKMSNYLGLRMAKTVTEKHQGILGFESTSEGACFWFELPIANSYTEETSKFGF